MPKHGSNASITLCRSKCKILERCDRETQLRNRAETEDGIDEGGLEEESAGVALDEDREVKDFAEFSCDGIFDVSWAYYTLEADADHCSELHLQAIARNDTRVDQLSMDVKILANSSQTQLVSKPNTLTNDAQRSGSSQQLRIDDDEHCGSVVKRPRRSLATSILSFSLILPSWLAQHSLQVNVCRAAQSWTLSLRPYRTISHDADIRGAISRADFDWMRNLIESGQATVFDRLENGSTLLHVCFGRVLLCLRSVDFSTANC